MADKDVDGILAALEPVFDQIVVTHNGSPRALDVEALAIARRGAVRPGAGDRRGHAARRHRDRDRARRGGRPATGEGFGGLGGVGIVITGSVVTAGAARTLFGNGTPR